MDNALSIKTNDYGRANLLSLVEWERVGFGSRVVLAMNRTELWFLL